MYSAACTSSCKKTQCKVYYLLSTNPDETYVSQCIRMQCGNRDIYGTPNCKGMTPWEMKWFYLFPIIDGQQSIHPIPSTCTSKSASSTKEIRVSMKKNGRNYRNSPLHAKRLVTVFLYKILWYCMANARAVVEQ